MTSRINNLEVRGTPKTVSMAQELADGRKVAAPNEVWVAALVGILPSDQKAKLYEMVEAMMRQREMQRPSTLAKVVADIIMPKGH